MNNALPTITLLPPILGETVPSINRFNIENPSLIYLCEKTAHRAICFCSVAIADRNRQTFHKRARTYWQQCTDGVAPFDGAILCWKENFSPSLPSAIHCRLGMASTFVAVFGPTCNGNLLPVPCRALCVCSTLLPPASETVATFPVCSSGTHCSNTQSRVLSHFVVGCIRTGSGSTSLAKAIRTRKMERKPVHSRWRQCLEEMADTGRGRNLDY